MRSTKKVIEKIIEESKNDKTAIEQIIEEAKKNGFKRVGISSWSFTVDAGGKTNSYILFKTVEGYENSLEIECYYKGSIVKRKIIPSGISEFDSIVASCMEEAKQKKGK